MSYNLCSSKNHLKNHSKGILVVFFCKKCLQKTTNIKRHEHECQILPRILIDNLDCFKHTLNLMRTLIAVSRRSCSQVYFWAPAKLCLLTSLVWTHLLSFDHSKFDANVRVSSFFHSRKSSHLSAKTIFPSIFFEFSGDKVEILQQPFRIGSMLKRFWHQFLDSISRAISPYNLIAGICRICVD